ncbi:unnamed protein product [Rhizophagus irregularis]|nr:unnamed protein product [Rhizophagus irregularis]
MTGISKLSLQNKIMGITTNNAANNLTFIDALAKNNNILKELDDRFLSQLRTLLGKIHYSPQRQEKLSSNYLL